MRTNGTHEAAFRIAPRDLSLVAVLATALISTGVSRAQSSAALASTSAAKSEATLASAASVPTTKTTASAAARPPSSGPHEGIAVHGYWTIDVRNPDGKPAKHLEFENQLCTTFTDPTSGALVRGGDSTLAFMLGSRNDASVGAWSIVLGTPELVQLPGGGPGGGGFTSGPNCAIFSQFSLAQGAIQEGSAALGPYDPLAFTCSGNCFPVLTASPALGPALGASPVLPTTSPSPSMNLSGQFTVPAGNPVTISAVGTDLFLCQGVPAEECRDSGDYLGQNNGQSLSGGAPCRVTEEYEYPPPTGFTNTLQPTGTPELTETSIVDCLPNDPSLTSEIVTYTVAGQGGRSPFSGVVLTGQNGVPGPFQVSGGQTVAVTWTLSFQ